MAIDWDGPTRQPCPECDRGPRDKSCGVTVETDRNGVAHCFRCGYVETRRGSDSTQRAGSRPARPPTSAKHEVLSAFGHELWNACGLIAGDGMAYLRARCCVIPPADGHLRYHPALRHPFSGAINPALVALVTDAVTGQPLSLHRTWICADGNKAPLDPPRAQLGNHRTLDAQKGICGVVRLWPDEDVTMGLGIAEGIETALSLAHAYSPVWACLNAGNLTAMPALGGIESLMIAADHDDAGIAAAEVCAQRWADAGREAAVIMPEQHRTDLNDLARAA